ncbi:MAG: YhbY family RNA-binding protein [Planctomycetes bacterium]|nr:YhbY family RNA-binding protein [Planctomycetota bacterium]
MSLSSKQRRELAAQAHHLKARVTVSADGLSAATIAHVRTAFTRQPLLKLRIQADSAAESEATARQLAAAIPCELVQRVGRVVVLYRPAEPELDGDV